MSQEGSVLEHPVVIGLREAVTALDPTGAGTAWQLGDTDVETGLGLLLDLEARAAAMQGALLGQAEGRDLKARTKASTVARWLGDRFRLSGADAAARLRTAAQLARHPQVAAALGRGRVTVEQATVTATALDHIAALPGLAEEDRAAAAGFLLDQCPALAPRDLARAGQAICEALAVAPSVDDPADQAALDREHAQAEAQAQAGERNELRVSRRRGRCHALLDLGPLGEATLLGWLRRADTPALGQDGFEDKRTRSERRGDAIVDLLTAAATPGTPPAGEDIRQPDPDSDPDSDPNEPSLFDHPDPDDPDPDDTDPGDADPGDADPFGDADPSGDSDPDSDPGDGDGDEDAGLPDEAAGAGNGAEPDDPAGPAGGPAGGPGSPASPLALLTVTTTLAELRAALAGAGHLDTGANLSAATLRQLACDALIVPAVLGGPSQILDLGRTTRLWNRAQRRAAALRDRGCVAPGCDQPPAACQLHHSRHWTDGGPTDLHNGALLCGFHHRMVHRQGWAVVLAANGYPQLIPPASIDPDRRPRQHHRFRLTPLTQLTGRHRS